MGRRISVSGASWPGAAEGKRMTVLQHYYTSFVNKETGVGGFQVQAMSPGISQEVQAVILRLISYRLPPSLDSQAAQKPPVALRYYYHSARESILLCSQSCGADENGRPGNFFAHSAVLPPDTFVTDPPFLYWHSSFWRKEATNTSSIAPLPSFSAEQKFDLLERVWSFLSEDGRVEAFTKLMSAVVVSGRANRRIVIIDSDEQVALWVAALTIMLPPSYRPLLSFATYHHDLEQSWFLITGIDNDTISRFSAGESSSHFVLRGLTNQCSQIEISSYARFVSAALLPESYDTYLLAAFADYERFFPAPTSGDLHDCFSRLDLFADYVQFRNRKERTVPGKRTLNAINGALDTFEQMSVYQDGDARELNDLERLLATARAKMSALDPYLLQTYERIGRLFQENRQSEESSTRILQEDLFFYTRQLLSDYPHVPYQAVIDKLRALLSSYGERTFGKGVNDPRFHQLCTELAEVAEARSNAYRAVWEQFGPYLEPGSELAAFFARSVRLWETLRQNPQTKGRATDLLRLIKGALEGRERAWFQLLLTTDLELTDETCSYFYWKIVSIRSLDERASLRTLLKRMIPDIQQRELGYDLRSSDFAGRVGRLKEWVAYVRQEQSEEPARFLQQAIAYAQQWYPQEQWRRFALNLLLEEELTPLLGAWEAALVRSLFEQVTFKDFQREHVRLYRLYAASSLLPAKARTVLAGMLAMSGEHVPEKGLQQLRQYFRDLSEIAYRQELTTFLSAFLYTEQQQELHARLIDALFQPARAGAFWSIYWNTLWAMLNKLSADELDRTLRILDFWFASSSELLLVTYTMQSFFLFLPTNLTLLQTRAEYREIVSNLESRASLYSWYAVFREVLSQPKGNLLTAGQEWVKNKWKQLSRGRGEEEKAEQQRSLNTAIVALFTRGEISAQHRANLAKLYRKIAREQFWPLYQEQLTQLILGDDIHHLLELLQFWFVEAGGAFAEGRGNFSLIQGFFISFAQSVELACKTGEARFTSCVQAVLTLSQKQNMQAIYAWYPLFQEFLRHFLPAEHSSKTSRKLK